MRGIQWWRGDTARMRLRRRLLVYSAPVALILVVVIVKSLSVVIAGGSAASAYSDRDAGELRRDVALLKVLNVLEPSKAHFAAGDLAVLDNRLEEADREFSESLARDDSCAVRVNLELVRETLGDRAASVFDTPTAVARYLSARTVVEQAPQGCFAGNNDADEQRRVIREDALRRLNEKIEAVQVPPPPPAPAPPAAPTAPPPQAQPGGASDDTETELRLEPRNGPPLDKLQQILRDAAALG